MNNLVSKVAEWSKKFTNVPVEAEKIVLEGDKAVLCHVTKDNTGRWYGMVSKFKLNDEGDLVLLTSGISKAEVYGEEKTVWTWYNKKENK